MSYFDVAQVFGVVQGLIDVSSFLFPGVVFIINFLFLPVYIILIVLLIKLLHLYVQEQWVLLPGAHPVVTWIGEGLRFIKDARLEFGWQEGAVVETLLLVVASSFKVGIVFSFA